MLVGFPRTHSTSSSDFGVGFFELDFGFENFRCGLHVLEVYSGFAIVNHFNDLSILSLQLLRECSATRKLLPNVWTGFGVI